MRILCVDFGSTFTKAGVVDVERGELVATASHRTTIGTDLMEALDAIRAELDAPGLEVRACSSAGGGLRVGVVGNEELVTVEAGRRVATSSGGIVVHFAAGRLDRAALDALRETSPDVVLLVGGTDGGNTHVLLANATALADARLGLPIVAAGNAVCRDEVASILERTPHVLADNVLPEIGAVRPESARAAIRNAFVEHVIGGKHLSRREEFASIVRGATPDLVLRGVEVLAASTGSDVAVVDVGGATTDVHSVVRLDEPEPGAADVVGGLPVSRTVEGDLGLRWNAPGIVEAAVEMGVTDLDAAALREAAARRLADPGFVAEDAHEVAIDERLATLAVTIALRRHAGRDQVRFDANGRVVERTGKDLRKVALLVGSGGLLRHSDPGLARRVLEGALVDDTGAGWLVPRDPTPAVDTAYVLAAAGLLAEDHPAAAAALAATLNPAK